MERNNDKRQARAATLAELARLLDIAGDEHMTGQISMHIDIGQGSIRKVAVTVARTVDIRKIVE